MAPITIPMLQSFNAHELRARGQDLKGDATSIDGLGSHFTNASDLHDVWMGEAHDVVQMKSVELASSLSRSGHSLMTIGGCACTFATAIEHAQSTVNNMVELVTKRLALPVKLDDVGHFYPRLPPQESLTDTPTAWDGIFSPAWGNYPFGEMLGAPKSIWPVNLKADYYAFDESVRSAEVAIADVMVEVNRLDGVLSDQIAAASVSLITSLSSPTAFDTTKITTDPVVWSLAVRSLVSKTGKSPQELNPLEVQAWINNLATVSDGGAAPRGLDQPWSRITTTPEPPPGGWTLPDYIDGLPTPTTDFEMGRNWGIALIPTILSVFPAGKVPGTTVTKIGDLLADQGGNKTLTTILNQLSIDTRRDAVYVGSIAGGGGAAGVDALQAPSGPGALPGPATAGVAAPDITIENTYGFAPSPDFQVNASSDADLIRQDTSYTPGKTVVIESNTTATGVAPNYLTNQNYLQELSDKLKAPVVVFSDGHPWIDNQGNAYASPSGVDDAGNIVPAWPPRGTVTEYHPR